MGSPNTDRMSIHMFVVLHGTAAHILFVVLHGIAAHIFDTCPHTCLYTHRYTSPEMFQGKRPYSWAVVNIYQTCPHTRPMPHDHAHIYTHAPYCRRHGARRSSRRRRCRRAARRRRGSRRRCVRRRSARRVSRRGRRCVRRRGAWGGGRLDAGRRCADGGRARPIDRDFGRRLRKKKSIAYSRGA